MVKAILADTHLHVYSCFDLQLLFKCALDNFNKIKIINKINNKEIAYVFFLTESCNCHFFDLLKKKQLIIPNDWQIEVKDEYCILIKACITKKAEENKLDEFYIFSGKQIKTQEGLEILAFFAKDNISDNLSVKETLNIIYNYNAVAVLTWAFGKWLLGKRRKIVKDIIKNKKVFFIGDSSLRPKAFFWDNFLFKKAVNNGIVILAGSDPLPAYNEEKYAGSYGVLIDGLSFDKDRPTDSLKQIFYKYKYKNKEKRCVQGVPSLDIKILGKRSNVFLSLFRQLRLRFLVNKK